jgi:hypothetical protein
MAQFCVIARAGVALHLRADQRRSHLQAALRAIGGSAFAGALTSQRPQGDLSW